MTTPENPSGNPAPKATHEQDLAEVQEQIKGADSLRGFSESRALLMRPDAPPAPWPSPLVRPPGVPGFATRTSFEGHDLNAMIDLVDQANPKELENAGTALWKARDALKAAAKELQDYVDKVDWKGEGAAAFMTFGRGLASHARSLSDFADTAGTQITVAGTGLASVHKAMPPRDGRLDKRKADEIPLPGRVEGNAAYDAAVKVEKDRQEAINQMNRLSSFYAVSQQTLALQEPPAFEQVLKANVPPPSGGGGPSEAAPRSSTAEMGTSAATAPPATARPDAVAAPAAAGGQAEAVGTPAATAPGAAVGGAAAGGVAPPGRDASMELAQAAPPAPAPAPAPAAPPSAPPTALPGPALGTPPPMVPGYAPPMRSGPVKAPGLPGNPVGRPGQPPMARSGPTGQPPMGRTGTPGQPPMGRTGTPGQPPMGRAGTTGQPPMGRTGTPGQPPMGRAGTTGQSPMGRAGTTGQPPMGRAGTTGQPSMGRTGRIEGITGGNPQRTAPARAAGSRVPTSGAIGAQPAAGSSARQVGRTAPAVNGVVGTPRNTASSTGRNSTGGFTQGGAGLVRGPAGSRNSEEPRDQEGSKRPDYLTEDEETWTAGRPGTVPPVIG